MIRVRCSPTLCYVVNSFSSAIRGHITLSSPVIKIIRTTPGSITGFCISLKRNVVRSWIQRHSQLIISPALGKINASLCQIQPNIGGELVLDVVGNVRALIGQWLIGTFFKRGQNSALTNHYHSSPTKSVRCIHYLGIASAL